MIHAANDLVNIERRYTSGTTARRNKIYKLKSHDPGVWIIPTLVSSYFDTVFMPLGPHRIMFITHTNLNDFFNEKIQTINCEEPTRAYILSIFKKYKYAEYDFSNQSVTILYCNAKDSQNFSKFQNLGDWLFFSETMFPKSLNAATPDYYETIARLSYYSCYRLINKQWKLFEELSDNYSYLIDETKKLCTF